MQEYLESQFGEMSALGCTLGMVPCAVLQQVCLPLTHNQVWSPPLHHRKEGRACWMNQCVGFGMVSGVLVA